LPIWSIQSAREKLAPIIDCNAAWRRVARRPTKYFARSPPRSRRRACPDFFSCSDGLFLALTGLENFARRQPFVNQVGPGFATNGGTEHAGRQSHERAVRRHAPAAFFCNRRARETVALRRFRVISDHSVNRYNGKRRRFLVSCPVGEPDSTPVSSPRHASPEHSLGLPQTAGARLRGAMPRGTAPCRHLDDDIEGERGRFKLNAWQNLPRAEQHQPAAVIARNPSYINHDCSWGASSFPTPGANRTPCHDNSQTNSRPF